MERIKKSDVTYYLQRKNGKVMMTVKIIANSMSMRCIINMYKLKRFYHYKHRNLTYRVYNDDCFNNKECDSKEKNVVGM